MSGKIVQLDFVCNSPPTRTLYASELSVDTCSNRAFLSMLEEGDLYNEHSPTISKLPKNPINTPLPPLSCYCCNTRKYKGKKQLLPHTTQYFSFANILDEVLDSSQDMLPCQTAVISCKLLGSKCPTDGHE